MNEIKCGDIVGVYWSGGTERLEDMTVIFVPVAGELWGFRDPHGNVYAINSQASNFDCIIKKASRGGET